MTVPVVPKPVDNLEDQLHQLLEIDRFEPPASFVDVAKITDSAVYEQAADGPAWWAEQARERLDWQTPFTTVLDDSSPPFYKWFSDGTLNVSYNCLDRHVERGLGSRIAFHWHGEEGEYRAVTYADLLADVQRLANGLLARGVRKGDVVGIFLPMIPEAVVAMLACARIGAPHTVVFGGFAPASVAERLEVSRAKALITVDGARRKGKTAAIKRAIDAEIGDLDALETVVVVRATGADCSMREGRDVWYDELLAGADPVCPAEPMEAEHPLFLLYSSGSTAKPKGIVHTTAGYLTGVSTTHDMVFDLDPEHDVFWCTADIGWITGHSYVVYGPLANGCTSVLFEGAPDYPDKDVWWDIIERYGVTIFYTAPTAIRACMKWGPEYPGRHDLSSLRLLGSVGEPINPKAWLWYHTVIGGERCPIVDTWWQTETGAIMISALPGLTATKPGSATRPLPGVSAALVDVDGEEIGVGTGLLVLTEPVPSMARTLLEDATATSRPTSSGSARAPTWSVMPPAATRTATSGSSAASTTSSTFPDTGSRPPRSSPRWCPTRRWPRRRSCRSPTSSPGRPSSPSSPCAPASRPTRNWRQRCANTSPSGSASSPGRRRSSSRSICRRRAPARSCAGCCATCPTGASSVTSRPWVIRPWSWRCKRN